MFMNAGTIPRLLAFVAIAVTVTACFDNEPEQRKAFITFLQTRVIDRQGVHVPKLSDDETKSIGPYLTHYKVITDFTGDPALSAMAGKLKGGLPNLTNIQTVIDNRDTLRKTSAEMGELMRAMNDRYAATQKERDALKQPDDLKPVYDKAFEKTVTAPVNAFRGVVPVAQRVLDGALKVVDYATSHTDTVKVVGGRLQATNAKTQSELTALVNTLLPEAARFDEAQHKLKVVLTGN
jgi:hypothetical protein